MDQLQLQIEKERDAAFACEKKSSELARQAEMHKLKYEHLMEAARLRPLPSSDESKSEDQDTKENNAPRRGKRPGSISKDWVSALRLLYGEQSNGRRHSAPDIQAAYAMVKGKEIDITSARDRIRYFLSQDPPLMEGDYDKAFVVTQSAADKFGFSVASEEETINGHDAGEGNGLFEQQEAPIMN